MSVPWFSAIIRAASQARCFASGNGTDFGVGSVWFPLFCISLLINRFCVHTFGGHLERLPVNNTLTHYISYQRGEKPARDAQNFRRTSQTIEVPGQKEIIYPHGTIMRRKPKVPQTLGR